MFHPVSPLSSLFGKPFCRLCFVLFVLGCVSSLCCFAWLPTLPRCRSFLPDLMTVRAVMVRAALEKKKSILQFRIQRYNANPPTMNLPSDLAFRHIKCHPPKSISQLVPCGARQTCMKHAPDGAAQQKCRMDFKSQRLGPL